MYYSEDTAMDRMTGISKYTQITLAIHLTGKLRFKFADLTKGTLTDLVFDLGAGFVGIITTQSLPGSKAGGLYGTTGALNVGTRVETHDTKVSPGQDVLRGALVTAVYPNQDLVTLSYDDEDDTENPANPIRTNMSAGQVMKCDCNPVLTAGISPGLYITMSRPTTSIVTTALKWAIDNVFGILKNFGFISPLSDLAASIMKGIADGLFGGSSGDYTTGLFMSTDGVGFMLKNLPPSAFIPIKLPLVGGLVDAFLPIMSFACTWMSGKSVKCMIDLQGPKWIAMIFEAIGWVVSRVMDTVVGAVKWAAASAKAVAAEVLKVGAAAGKVVQAAFNAVEAGFSELANSVAGLTDALYEGAGRAAVAVAKGADWIYDQFSDFFGDIFGGLFGRRLLGYNWGISWLQLGYDSSLYHPHPLVELLNKQGRHDEALDLSEKLVKINRNLYVHRGKLSEAKPYTKKLLEIQNYRANHSPWNEAASDHTHISPWHDTESDGSWTESDVPWPTDDASDNNAWDQEL